MLHSGPLKGCIKRWKLDGGQLCCTYTFTARNSAPLPGSHIKEFSTVFFSNGHYSWCSVAFALVFLPGISTPAVWGTSTVGMAKITVKEHTFPPKFLRDLRHQWEGTACVCVCVRSSGRINSHRKQPIFWFMSKCTVLGFVQVISYYASGVNI